MPHMRLVCVTNQVHAGTEPSKQTKWEQYFHTLPPSCAILPTMSFVCYLLLGSLELWKAVDLMVLNV